MTELIKEKIAPRDTTKIEKEISEDANKVLVSAKSKETQDIELTVAWLVEGEEISTTTKKISECPLKIEPLTDKMELRIGNRDKEVEAEVIGAIREKKGK